MHVEVTCKNVTGGRKDVKKIPTKHRTLLAIKQPKACKNIIISVHITYLHTQETPILYKATCKTAGTEVTDIISEIIH